MVKDPSFRRMVEAYLNCVDPDGDITTHFDLE